MDWTKRVARAFLCLAPPCVALLIAGCRPSFKDFAIVETLPHDTAAYTQGLIFHKGQLFESTGEYGRSQLRRLDLRSGAVLASVRLPPDRFGEGLTLLNGRLYQLTWQSHVGYVYDASTLAVIDSFTYAGEGWGLTSDDDHLIMSDGTATLKFLNPKTFQIDRVDTVHDGDGALSRLNELEYVHGEVFANIYWSNWIVRIDPSTGRIKGWIDCAGLLSPRQRTARTNVLNGIAYNESTGTFLLTGKRWPLLFAIRLRSDSA